MRVLFINPDKQRCGVHQYGRRLHSILAESKKLEVHEGPIGSTPPCDVIIYNWHPIIDPGMSAIGFLPPGWEKAKRAIIYHDGEVNDSLVDAVLFSDPSSPANRNKWHHIGRPLPDFLPRTRNPLGDQVVVGIHGFCGAWAVRVVEKVSNEYERATIRMLLPPSDHCDPSAATARAVADQCMAVRGAGITISVTHDFLTELGLLEWLSHNDVNCFIRDPAPSSGISSALDAALAVRRPIAINRHPMFRHMTNLEPSICVDDLSIGQIIRNGLTPLVPVYDRNRREMVRAEVELILDCLFLSNERYGSKASP